MAFEKLFEYLSSNQISSSNVDSLSRVRSTVSKIAFESYYSYRSAITKSYKSYITALENFFRNADLGADYEHGVNWLSIA